MPREEDLVRLRHMLDAAQEAMAHAAGRSRADLDSNRMLMHSLVRLLEIIGEAAAQVSQEGRNQLAGLEWRAIVGMRHRIVHAYFDINLDRVWDTVTEDLPPLAAQLSEALKREADT